MLLFSHPSYGVSPYSRFQPSQEELYYQALADQHERRARAARARQEQEALQRAALNRQRSSRYPNYYSSLFPPSRPSPTPAFSQFPRQTVWPERDGDIRHAIAERKRRVREEELRHQAASEARKRQLWNSLFGQYPDQQDEVDDIEVEKKVR